MKRLLLIAFLALAVSTGAGPRRRALLVGIDDYQSAARSQDALEREWPNLRGAVNDVRLMQELLVLLRGFDRKDIVTLTNAQASRAAILHSLQTLAQGAKTDDVIFFYFAGHGSQVLNTKSEELDKLDESIVPADSRAGAADIRDKELRRIFNRILDRGARLTVLLDSCHSGSGARGLPAGLRVRGIAPDLRDVADGSDAGPHPEDRGALVVSASQDLEQARERRDPQKQWHGNFTWAWARALCDATPSEPAMETFLRAQARVRAETPVQDPVIAGNSAARQPFLAFRNAPPIDRPVIAVRRQRADGTVELQGGWAHGLAAGSQLRLKNDHGTRLTITRILGPSRSIAQTTAPVATSALLEIAAWAAPEGQPLRVWIPRGTVDARAIYEHARRRKLKWISDPTEARASYVLRMRGAQWELLSTRAAMFTSAARAIDAIPQGSPLFVQVPIPGPLQLDGVVSVDEPEEADYILTGRFAGGQTEYAWVRPSISAGDRTRSGLPVRTAWHRDRRELAADALVLRRVHAWYQLDSPAVWRSPYRLTIRRERDARAIAANEPLIGDERYTLSITADSLPRNVRERYFYAFVIDSHGKAVLLFPRHGSVENRFPLDPAAPPAEIPLGPEGLFEVGAPYGTDTYFLLTTDEPLSDPHVLEWDGVRGRPAAKSALESLLLTTAAGSRSARAVPPPSAWSLERIVRQSVPPR